MSRRMKCPSCHETIDSIDISGYYNEQGSFSGNLRVGSHDDYSEISDQDSNDSEFTVEDYCCPECNADIDYDYIENAADSDMEVYNEDEDDEDYIMPPSSLNPGMVGIGVTGVNMRTGNVIFRDSPQDGIIPNSNIRVTELEIPSGDAYISNIIRCSKCNQEIGYTNDLEEVCPMCGEEINN